MHLTNTCQMTREEGHRHEFHELIDPSSLWHFSFVSITRVHHIVQLSYMRRISSTKCLLKIFFDSNSLFKLQESTKPSAISSLTCSKIRKWFKRRKCFSINMKICICSFFFFFVFLMSVRIFL